MAPDSDVNFSGDGFAPSSDIDIEFHSEPVLLLETTAEENGAFDVLVTIPSDATDGPHQLVASGVNSSGASHTVTVDLVVRVCTITGTEDTSTER